MTEPAAASWWTRLSTSMKVMLVTVGTIIVVAAVVITVTILNRPEPVALPAGDSAEAHLDDIKALFWAHGAAGVLGSQALAGKVDAQLLLRLLPS